MGFLGASLSRNFLFNSPRLIMISNRSFLFSPFKERINCCYFSCFRLLQAKEKRQKDAPSRVKVNAPKFNTGMSDTVCSGANYFTTGEDPTLKDDSQYPDWLWTLLDEPSEDSKTYRRRQNKLKARAKNKEMQRQHYM